MAATVTLHTEAATHQKRAQDKHRYVTSLHYLYTGRAKRARSAKVRGLLLRGPEICAKAQDAPPTDIRAHLDFAELLIVHARENGNGDEEEEIDRKTRAGWNLAHATVAFCEREFGTCAEATLATKLYVIALALGQTHLSEVLAFVPELDDVIRVAWTAPQSAVLRDATLKKAAVLLACAADAEEALASLQRLPRSSQEGDPCVAGMLSACLWSCGDHDAAQRVADDELRCWSAARATSEVGIATYTNTIR